MPTPAPAADDFIDELASDGIELVLANPSQQVGQAGLADVPISAAPQLSMCLICCGPACAAVLRSCKGPVVHQARLLPCLSCKRPVGKPTLSPPPPPTPTHPFPLSLLRRCCWL